MENEQDLKNEMKEWQTAALQDLRVHLNRWNPFVIQEGEEKMATNEAGKEKTIEEISRMCEFQQEWNHGMVKWSNEIDKLIARHKATLDLLAKPAYPKTEPFLRAALDAEAVKKIVERVEELMAQYAYEIPRMTQEEIESADKTMNEYKPEPEPAQECGCIDKAKLLNRLEDRIKKEQAHEKKHATHKVYGQAGASRERARALINLLREINMNQFDRAPCKPEPAPAETGEVIGFLPYYKDGESYIKVRLDDGTFAFFRGMPEEEWEREHTCRCSTANLVEQLRSRASVADGIDVTDLGADQLMSIRWNRPATVIAVRKEENRS